MEIYETLFITTASDLDPDNDKVIRFNWLDEDSEPYVETVQVTGIDYEGKYVIVYGYSEVLNENDEWGIYEDTEVEVLGG